jgi:hypothetical protein
VKSSSLAISLLVLWIILEVAADLSLMLGRSACYDAFEKQKSQSVISDVFAIEVKNFDNFSWEKAGKEFYLNGKLYDVVSAQLVDGVWSCNCVLDKRENELLSAYNKLLDDKGRSKSTDTSVVQKLKAVYCAVPDEQVNWYVEYKMPKYVDLKTDLPDAVSLFLFSPPPECNVLG